MNPISFGSTYVVVHESYTDKLSKFQFMAQNESELGARMFFGDEVNHEKREILPTITLVAPDERDEAIESYCLQNGIKYTKYKTEDLIKPEAIAKRIAPAKEGFQIVEVDVEKLERLLQKQSSNFKHCEGDYEKYYKHDTQMMLRKADNVSASTLYIMSNDSSNEDLIEYIDRFGADKLNDKQIGIWLNQETNHPDHCMYFAMKELGMKKAPVYVDEQISILCEKLGLLD